MKKPMPLIVLVFLLLLPLLGRAQESVVSGRVVDSATKEPVPFASLSLREEKTGALTTEEGYFQMAGLLNNQRDSLICMALAYSRKAVSVKGGETGELQIEMTVLPMGVIKMGPCATVDKDKKVVLVLDGNEKVSPLSQKERIAGTPGTQYAFFVGNEKQKKLGKIQTVSFYIGENGLPMEPFRIRIYKADGNYYSPKTDLLNEQIFLTATRPGEWYTSDVSRYNISVPEDGYFIALEFGKPASVLSQPVLENHVFTGLIMRPEFSVKKSRIWSYTQKYGWHLFSQPKGSSRYNAMVKVEVESSE